jgi:hypothetical protein
VVGFYRQVDGMKEVVLRTEFTKTKQVTGDSEHLILNNFFPRNY